MKENKHKNFKFKCYQNKIFVQDLCHTNWNFFPINKWYEIWQTVMEVSDLSDPKDFDQLRIFEVSFIPVLFLKY